MNEQIILFTLQLVFYVVIPAIAVYFIIRKKIRISFVVGICLASFLFGLLIMATVRQKDEVASFVSYVNNDNYTEAKKKYKIIIQYGADQLATIDKTKITNLKLYNQLTSDIINEYHQVVEQFIIKYEYNEKKPLFDDQCKEHSLVQNNQLHLNHALLLLRFSESIGDDVTELKKRVKKVFEHNEIILKQLKNKCSDN